MDNSYIDDIYLINNESYYFHREIGEWLVLSIKVLPGTISRVIPDSKKACAPQQAERQ